MATRRLPGNSIMWGRSEKAVLTTNLTGTNNDLTYTADLADSTGNAITVAYVVAGVSTPLSVSVTGSAITVNVATTAGSAASSTAAQVSAAVTASGPASALVDVTNAPGNDGTGVVTAMAATPLTGGRSGGVGIGDGVWKPKRPNPRRVQWF